MMTVKNLALGALLLGTGVAAGAAYVQDDGPPRPKELDVFERSTGTWDCDMTWWMMGQEMSGMKGTDEVEWALGNRWIQADFSMEYMGMPFQGRSMMSWDEHEEKYIQIWMDAMSGHPAISFGTWDEATKTLTSRGLGIDSMTGEETETKSVTKVHGPDAHSFTMYQVDEEGEETKTMHIEYKRKK